MKVSKKKVVLLILIFSISIIFYIFFYKTTCETEECFQEHSKFCSPAKYDKLVNNNIYKYKISMSFGKNCKVEVKLERAAIGTDFETKTKLEGKSMKCSIPKTELENIAISEVENFLSYCTGPLKEGIYEIIIKKMYSSLISNLGEILGEVQTKLIKQL